MVIGIMQPYFLPYIGYWELMAQTDRYVIYDDVNYIKGGWVNRNRILVNGQPTFINVPTVGPSPNKKICEVGCDISDIYLKKLGHKIEFAYRKAPYFETVFPVLMEILSYQTDSLSSYLSHTIRNLAKNMGIETEFILSSELNCGVGLERADRLIEICRKLEGDVYYNAIGGTSLYDKEYFRMHGIELRFWQSEFPSYQQFQNEFVPWLSIVDVLMFLGWDCLRGDHLE